MSNVLRETQKYVWRNSTFLTLAVKDMQVLPLVMKVKVANEEADDHKSIESLSSCSLSWAFLTAPPSLPWSSVLCTLQSYGAHFWLFVCFFASASFLAGVSPVGFSSVSLVVLSRSGSPCSLLASVSLQHMVCVSEHLDEKDVFLGVERSFLSYETSKCKKMQRD
ncbi:hypothetical protein DSO57_1005509 [Entomophthora muscae]|uniref:Uncharacterized protein n=1 Tax=Entomophthora muscae TaxID=34485 RepID=A0ACC2SWX6_9FUNG|nr:hypothetical protein DSO57_1005509 [Entomophthora muscae]